MRTISSIVIHHSATPRDQDIYRAVESFNRSHRTALYERWQQPLSGTQFPYVAYHYLIGHDGTIIQTRDDNIVGYHAGNYQVNLTSIALCVVGNFTKETPTQAQLNRLRNKINQLHDQYGPLTLYEHREVRTQGTVCPAFNFKSALQMPTPQTPNQPRNLEQIFYDYARAYSLEHLSDEQILTLHNAEQIRENAVKNFDNVLGLLRNQ